MPPQKFHVFEQQFKKEMNKIGQRIRKLHSFTFSSKLLSALQIGNTDDIICKQLSIHFVHKISHFLNFLGSYTFSHPHSQCMFRRIAFYITYFYYGVRKCVTSKKTEKMWNFMYKVNEELLAYAIIIANLQS